MQGGKDINIRKGIAYFFASVLFMVLLWHIINKIKYSNFGILDLPYVVFMLVLILIILSDFNILHFKLTEWIYVLIESPDKSITKIETLDEISDTVNCNFKSNKYVEETNNSEIKVIGKKDDSFILDTRDVFKSIKEGLIFTLFFKEEFEYSGEKSLIPTQNIAMLKVVFVGPLSKGEIIQKHKFSSSYNGKFKKVMAGQFVGTNVYLKIKLDDNFKNISSEKLKSLSDLINVIRTEAMK